MKVLTVRLQNFRSFVDSGTVEFGSVNVLIGANNSGKSSVLRGLHQLQVGLTDIFGDVRVGSAGAIVDIRLGDSPNVQAWAAPIGAEKLDVEATLHSGDRRAGNIHLKIKIGDILFNQGDLRLHNIEPSHFVVPYFSKRKTTQYNN